jgi:hypothetical protein
MQEHPEGRQTRVTRRWAAECIAAEFAGDGTDGCEAAEAFLAEEELDSGIVAAREGNLQFWHLSFQEFLAARALSAQSEIIQQQKLLKDRAKLLSPEWRETVLLFAGVLHQQGAQKVDSMIESILEGEGKVGSLIALAPVVGLVGGIQRDLSSAGYRIRNPRFDEMIQRFMIIFDREGAESVPFEARFEAAEALGQTGDPRLGGDTWVFLPAGRFLLGAQAADPSLAGYDPCALPSEGPPIEIELAAMRIGRYPVTVGEYQRFVQDGGYETAAFWSAGGFGRWKRPEQWENQAPYSNRPVTGVSWYEAAAYCAWRGQRVRLPRQSEWERVARGDSGRCFPWGNDLPDATRANFDMPDTSTDRARDAAPLSNHARRHVSGRRDSRRSERHGRQYLRVVFR